MVPILPKSAPPARGILVFSPSSVVVLFSGTHQGPGHMYSAAIEAPQDSKKEGLQVVLSAFFLAP